MATENITPRHAAVLLGGITRQRVQQLVANGILTSAGKFGSTTMITMASVLKEKRRREKKTNGKPKRKA